MSEDTGRRQVTVRRFESAAEADRADLAYWQHVPAAERILQVWRLSVEQWRLRDTPYEPGLRRSIARVCRR